MKALSKLVLVVASLLLFIQCKAPTEPIKDMDAESPQKFHELQNRPQNPPEQVYSSIWTFIVENKNPVSDDLRQYHVRTKFYQEPKELLDGQHLDKSSPVFEAAERMHGSFYIIDYFPANFRILGGSYKVVVKSDDYKNFTIISGV